MMYNIWVMLQLLGGTSVLGLLSNVAAGPAGSAFNCPSLILLRQKVADALESHWDKLEGLIDFGLSCSTRIARLALVRMLVRMAGLGAGMAPLLGPKVCAGPGKAWQAPAQKEVAART